MEKRGLRKMYGETLVALGKTNRDIVVLEADLGKSTMSILFKEAFPERYFEMGIAEQNMCSTAAGFALTGKIPFISTFAVFAAGRAFDQIRCSVAIPRANVKICGSSCGLSDFGDGKTHQSVEDANIIRAIPNMTVLNPCDVNEVRKMLRVMVEYQGPVYIRINRNDLPVYTPAEGDYQIGKIYPIPEDAEGEDVAVFATGVMVDKSVEAAESLRKEGISVQVLNVSTLKPLVKDEILKYAAGKKAVITAEEAVKTGGLGASIASILMEEGNFGGSRAAFGQVGIEDLFGTSAHSYDELLVKYKLSARDIYKAVKKALCK
ncbi:MAG: transketolase family protein [Spirochaetaceae bacterium]|jgi:transketolase|nr:transketolase family protein [Spirochaetaceae bacterium]